MTDATSSIMTHPTAAELLEAVMEWLAESQPTRQGRDAYLALVARNALATVLRELQQGPAMVSGSANRLSDLLNMQAEPAELRDMLIEQIRTGKIAANNPALLVHLAAETKARLAIDQPKYKPAP